MKQHYNIYTDGSHLDKQNNGRLGVGGVLVLPSSTGGIGKLIDKFSTELIESYMNLYFGTTKCSNPSAELVAVLHSLYNFSKYFTNEDTISIYADYIGVREWMTGKWKIKEPYIARIKSDIDEEIRKLGLVGRIDYNWIKGHQKNTKSIIDPDIYWNNYVDLLAKGKNQDV